MLPERWTPDTPLFDFDFRDLENCRTRNRLPETAGQLVGAAWLLPECDRCLGSNSRIAVKLAQALYGAGVQPYFFVAGTGKQGAAYETILGAFPDCRPEWVFVDRALGRHCRWAGAPRVDVGVAADWTTAYAALALDGVDRAFYLINDYYPCLFGAGTLRAYVENTLDFGLYGICRSPYLCRVYEQRHRSAAFACPYTCDPNFYYPAHTPTDEWRVVCCGSPDMEKYTWELILTAMILLKTRLGSEVTIMVTGSGWDSLLKGLGGVVERCDLSSPSAVADLYRSSAVAVSLTNSYQPSDTIVDAMACGCMAVTNRNPATGWFLRDGDNCLLSHAAPTALKDVVLEALEDVTKRRSIRRRGLKTVDDIFCESGRRTSGLRQFLCNPNSCVPGTGDGGTRLAAITDPAEIRGAAITIDQVSSDPAG